MLTFPSDKSQSSLTQHHAFALLLGFAVLLPILSSVAGCATPVGVQYLDPKQVQRTLIASVLSGDEVSAPTAQILNRAGLSKAFRTQPAEVLATLHRGLPTANEADRLFALAELSYAFASRSGPRPYYLASALYACAFLFPTEGRSAPDRFDPRVRVALDLYNRGIAEAFASADRSRVEIADGVYHLPFGEITIGVNPAEFYWGSYRLVNFVQAAQPLPVARDWRPSGGWSRPCQGHRRSHLFACAASDQGGRHRFSAAGRS